ncbi:30S ribosomal protein S2 [Patescibacteria group bacterium]|nr:30S ribosomal protein S2 [Patescibacteria group bacterium]
MKQITLEELLEAGCHFGHQVTRSNPKARDFVFEARDNIQIIDLAKTKDGLDEAADFVKHLGQNGGNLLVVGTKRQAKEIVEQEINRINDLLKESKKEHIGNIYYITQRWIGGILTNFAEVSKNFKKLKDLKETVSNPEAAGKYTKKEIGLFEKEIQKLESYYKGVSEMKDKPQALFIIDSHLEDLAVREARNMGVETVAIVDTNADPYLIDHPIPANDDAVGSIRLILAHILDAWEEGVKAQKQPSAKAPDGKQPKAEKQEKPKAEQAENVSKNKNKKTENPKTKTSKETKQSHKKEKSGK